jgi:hypothetical protein
MPYTQFDAQVMRQAHSGSTTPQPSSSQGRCACASGVVLPLWAWRMTWASNWVYGMSGLFIGLAVAYGVDVMLRKQLPWPSWFLQLRLWLTLGALLGLGLTLVRLYTLKPAG